MYVLNVLKSNISILSRRSSIFKTNVHIQRQYMNDISYGDIPEVSPALIKRTLKSNSLGYEDGFTCFITQCTMCHKSAKTGPGKVYINKTTGMYMCSFCKKFGEWNEFELLFITNKKKRPKGKNEEVVIREIDIWKESLREIKENTGHINQLSEETVLELLQKFKLPVIPSHYLQTLDVRINNSKNTIYFPLENSESEIVGYRTINAKQKEETLPNIHYGGLLTAKMQKSKDTAILVPNVSDFLVLLNSKVTGNIVCLPNGLNNLSQYVLPSLERFKKLILWLGNDMKAWDSARNFAKKLNEKRCLFIRPSDKTSLPHELNEEDLKATISSAQPMFHKSITTFASLRQDVLSDLQNIDKVQGVKWKRFPTLNKILKGHRPGELSVITGPTGSGKTTFISEYSLDLAMQGVNTLWGSFEIRNARLARTMLTQMAGLPLDENLQFFDTWADEFEKLPIYFMTFHGQQSIKVVMEAVEHATYVHDIAHVIIDNVQFMMGLTDETRHMDRFWKQDAIIASFRTFATRKNCHVTLVIHPRKEREDEDLTTSSIFGGAKASQEADNVLIIQDKRLTSVRGKKFLQVAKNRYSGDLGIMALDFNKSSLSFVKKPNKKSEEKSEKQHVPQTPQSDDNVREP